MTHSVHDAACTLPWWRQRAIIITVAMVGLLIVLITINANIIKYENHLASGKTALLELAPVDPRSFMQGDYMALNYQLENDIIRALSARVLKPPTEEVIEDDWENSDWIRPTLPEQFWNYDGVVILRLDTHRVGHFARLADTPNKTADNEIALRYKIRDGSVYIATNAFFFQEGHSEDFEAAKFGLFRVNDKGAPLLQSMISKDFQVIAPEK